MKKKTIIITILIIALVLIIGGIGIYAFKVFNDISGEKLDESKLSITKNLSGTVLNVALFGLDGRDDPEVEGDRSDTIMIGSVDFDTGEIKVVSVMRDLMAQIPATENTLSYLEKINAAYSFGGAQAAVQALNENFDLNISDYVAVDFNCVVDAVDAIGGVDIDIQNEDVLSWTNEYIWDVEANVGKETVPIPHIGINHLDGIQALSYCRNRYSDSDYGRTERQREVLSQMAQKAMNMDLMTTVKLISKIYPYVKTSFTLSEITDYYKGFMALENRNITTSRLPFDGVNTMGMINEISYVIPTTMADNTKVLHGLLYGEDNYQPSETAMAISNQITGHSGYGSSVDWTTTTWQDIVNNQTSVRDAGRGEVDPGNYPAISNDAAHSDAPKN